MGLDDSASVFSRSAGVDGCLITQSFLRCPFIPVSSALRRAVGILGGLPKPDAARRSVVDAGGGSVLPHRFAKGAAVGFARNQDRGEALSGWARPVTVKAFLSAEQ